MIRPDIIIRRFKRNIGMKIVSIICLSIAFSCLIIISAYTKFELSFDKFHTKANRIVRVTTESKEGLSDARLYGDKDIYDLTKSIPGIECVTRISTLRRATLSFDNKTFNFERVYYVDSTFFKVFDFKVKTGDRINPFPNYASIIVSEGFAKKYFGTEDIIGKLLKVTSQEIDGENSFSIVGIMYDFPENSHFKAEALIPMPKDYNYFAYTYLQLQRADDIVTMPDKIYNLYRSELNDSIKIPKFQVQPISDIHLHSSKAREYERNGSYQSLLLLISSVLLVLIIALINLSNNSRVLFLKNRDYYILKRTHGATIMNLLAEEFLQSLILSVFIIIIGFWFIFYLIKLIGIDVFEILTISQLFSISILFAAVLILVMVLPIIRYFIKDFFSMSRSAENSFLSKSKSLAMRVFIIAQITISVFVIIMSIGVSKQMNYILSTQLGGKTSNIIVFANQSEKATKNFDKLKQELLRDPKILSVTAAMEPPAGAVKDRTIIELEGEEQIAPIDLLCIEGDFFNFFNLKPIEGTLLPRYRYSYDWELNTILALRGVKPPNELERPTEFSDNFIINKSALLQLGFSNPQDAIGKRIRLTSHPYLDIIPGGKIVGVIDDFKYTSMFEKERPLIILERRLFTSNFLVQYDTTNTKEVLVSINEKWQKINPDSPFNYETLKEVYRDIYYNEFSTKRFLSYFSILSLLISALGLAVMMAFFIRYRIKEIGIRKVNGANTFDILILLNKNLIVWVIISFCIASPMAYFAMERWLRNFAYQTFMSWWVFVGAGIVALVVALITVSWQSFKAARMNPVDAIRYE